MRTRHLAVLTAGIMAATLCLTPPAHGQRQKSFVRMPGRFMPTFHNPFINYPLTPYIGVGQAAGIMNTLAFTAFWGFPPPGGGPFANFPLTAHLGVGQAVGIMSTLGRGFPGYLSALGGFTPALYGGLGYPGAYSPYWGGGGYGGYGGGYGGYGGGTPSYGGGSASMATAPNVQSPQLSTMPLPASALAGLTTQGGGLNWPLGLRVLEPKEQSKELRRRIDGIVSTMFQEKAGPEGTPDLLKDLSKDVDKLDRMYRANAWDMALTRQQRSDVQRFLRKINTALLAAEESARQYATQMKAQGGQSPNQGDNYGQPQGQGGGQQPRQPGEVPPPQQLAPGQQQPKGTPQPMQPGQTNPKPQPGTSPEPPNKPKPGSPTPQPPEPGEKKK
jgi:hypothetical protein